MIDHEATEPSRSRRGSSGWLLGWPAVVVMLALVTLSFLDRQIIALMVDPIRADLGISDFQISLLQGFAFGLFYTIFGLPLGWLVDRVSRRWIIYAGVTVWSLAASACGLASSWVQLFLARLGVGAGEAALSPAAYSMIADMFPPRRLAIALAVFSTGATIGTALAVALGGWIITAIGNVDHVALPLIGDVRPWQTVFIITGAPGVLLALAAFTLKEPTRKSRMSTPDGSAVSRAGLLAFLGARQRLFTCHFLGFGCVSMMGYAIGSWMPTYLIRHFGWPPVDVGGAIAVVLLAGAIPGGLFSGWMVDRMVAGGRTDAHFRYYGIAVFVLMAAGVGAFFTDNVWVFLALMWVAQLITPFSGVAAAALQQVTPGHLRGQVSALYLFVFNLLGLGLGATIVAAFTDFVFRDPQAVGYSIASTVALLAPLSALLFLLGRTPLREAVEAAKMWTEELAHLTPEAAEEQRD